MRSENALLLPAVDVSLQLARGAPGTTGVCHAVHTQRSLGTQTRGQTPEQIYRRKLSDDQALTNYCTSGSVVMLGCLLFLNSPITLRNAITLSVYRSSTWTEAGTNV